MKYLALLDFDSVFKNDPDAKVVPYGTEMYTSNKQSKEFVDQLFKEDSGDLNFSSSCDCGELTGNFYLGETCSLCNTKVRSSFAGELKYRAWLEIPEYMPPILHPAAYRVFRKWLSSYNKKQLIDSILDVNGEVPDDYPVQPGFKSFYENFDTIMQYFLTVYKKTTSKKSRERFKHIPEFITKYRDILFVRHIPVLNQNLHLVTKSGSLTYTDESSMHIFKTLIELSNLAYIYTTTSKTEMYLEQNMKDMYYSYLEYTDSIIYTKIAKKRGFIRKYILGTRCHFSFRAVIVPITIDHMGDELHVPWRVAVTGLRLEILNLLQHRQGKSINEALDIYHKALFTYDENVYQLMMTLITECPYKGLPVIFGRNPTLQHGSIQLLFVTTIKQDLADNTIGFSPLVLSAPNADFDGDAMYGSFLKEMDEVPKYYPIHPKTTMLGEDTLTLSNAVNITTNARIALHAWLFDEEQVT